MYGVMPWDLSRLTPAEFESMVDALNARARAAEKQRRELEARH